MKKTLLWLAGILGILFIALAVYYWMTPAGQLPTFLPGYIAGDAAVHVKHGIAALIVGLALFVYVWFGSASKKPTV